VHVPSGLLVWPDEWHWILKTGQLAKTLRQQIPCGIDIAVVVGAASWACPLSLIQPEHIECVLAHRASLARGIPTIHLDQNPTVPVTFVGELPANLAERSVLDRASTSAARLESG
jgi:hypothetical protein